MKFVLDIVLSRILFTKWLEVLDSFMDSGLTLTSGNGLLCRPQVWLDKQQEGLKALIFTTISQPSIDRGLCPFHHLLGEPVLAPILIDPQVVKHPLPQISTWALYVRLTRLSAHATDQLIMVPHVISNTITHLS